MEDIYQVKSHPVNEKTIEGLIKGFQTKTKRISTGLQGLDDLIGGGYKEEAGELGVIFGKFGVGKTALLTNLASCFIETNEKPKVLVLTYEIEGHIYLQRIMGNMLDIPLTNLEHIPPHELKEQWMDHIGEKGTPLVIVDIYPKTLQDFENTFLELKKKHGPFNLVIVDQLTNMIRSSKNDNMHSAGDEIIQFLRDLAKQEVTNIWAVSQFNREGYKGEPDSSAVGRSSAFLECPDHALGFWREYGSLKGKVFKSRSRSVRGVVAFNFDHETLKITDIEDADASQ